MNYKPCPKLCIFGLILFLQIAVLYTFPKRDLAVAIDYIDWGYASDSVNVDDDAGSTDSQGRYGFSKEDDKYDNFKISSVSGESQFINEKGDKQNYYLTDDKTPKIKFKRGENADSVKKYKILLSKADRYWHKQDEKTYITIDNQIIGDGENVVKHDDFKVKYKKDNIEIDPGKDKKLDKGRYFVKIRAYDTDYNYSDSSEIRMKIDSIPSPVVEDDLKKVTNDSAIKIDTIGNVAYKDNYKTFYYTTSRNNINIKGSIVPKQEGVKLEFYLGDTKVGEGVTNAEGLYDVNITTNKGNFKFTIKSLNKSESGQYPEKTLTLIFQ